jgi:hypothetical protein
VKSKYVGICKATGLKVLAPKMRLPKARQKAIAAAVKMVIEARQP